MWTAGNGPDGGVDIGFRTVDAIVGAAVIGRRTFDLGVGPWGGTPWPGVPSFVVTHRTREDLLGDNGGTFALDGLEAAARRARDAAGDKNVLVLGAHVAGQLLRAGLLDEVRIHLVPLLLGEGTPLFAGERAELIPEGKPVAAAQPATGAGASQDRVPRTRSVKRPATCRCRSAGRSDSAISDSAIGEHPVQLGVALVDTGLHAAAQPRVPALEAVA